MSQQHYRRPDQYPANGASVQTTANSDYIYQAMVIAALKLTKPSLLSSDRNVSKTENGTQAKQATLENWISQCILLLQKACATIDA
jgi:hypothetical protein